MKITIPAFLEDDLKQIKNFLENALGKGEGEEVSDENLGVFLVLTARKFIENKEEERNETLL